MSMKKPTGPCSGCGEMTEQLVNATLQIWYCEDCIARERYPDTQDPHETTTPDEGDDTP